MPIDPRIPDAWEDAKNVGRKLSSVAFGIPETDHIAEIRARLSTSDRNMRINAETYNNLSAYIEGGIHAAEILITNTLDVTPEKLGELPRSMQDAARVLLAGSETLKAVKRKSKGHQRELKKIEREAREERKRRIDDDVARLALEKAEGMAKPHAEKLPGEMTAKAKKNIEVSERVIALTRLAEWKNGEIESIESHKERKWRDTYLEWKEKFSKEETQRIENENGATYEKYKKLWTERAEEAKQKEMDESKKEYITGEKRKRDDIEDKLRGQVGNLNDRISDQWREIKKLKTRLRSCKCVTGSDSDGSDNDGDGSDDGEDDDDEGDDDGGNGGSNGGRGGNALSRAPPLPSSRPSRGSTGGRRPGTSPPTGPKEITDARDRNPHNAGSRYPPYNPYDQGTRPSSGSGTAPARYGPKPPNHFDNAKKRPPGGWPDENVRRKPLSDNPFDEAQAQMLEDMQKNLAPTPGNEKKPVPKFGQPSGPPRPGQFGASSNTPTSTAGTARNTTTPGIFGSGTRVMNGGFKPPGRGKDTPADDVGSGSHVLPWVDDPHNLG